MCCFCNVGVKGWFLAVGRWLGRGELKVFSRCCKIPGCLNTSPLSLRTAFHVILFKEILRFMAFASLGAVKSCPAWVKAISGQVNICSEVIYLVSWESQRGLCNANVASVLCSFLPLKLSKLYNIICKVLNVTHHAHVVHPVLSATRSWSSYLSHLMAHSHEGKDEVLKSRVH